MSSKDILKIILAIIGNLAVFLTQIEFAQADPVLCRSKSGALSLKSKCGRGVQVTLRDLGLETSQSNPGPQGAIGPQGATGAQGPVGPQGAVGPQGPAGVAGRDGIAGRDGAAGRDGTPGLNGRDGVSSGVPKIVWAGPRSIAVLGQVIALNGFRFNGSYSEQNGVTKRILTPGASWLYEANLFGVGEPTLDASYPEMWVGVFGAAAAGDEFANIQFVPFYSVVSYDQGSGETVVDVRSGSLAGNAFSQASLQVVTEGGVFSNKVVQIRGNSTNSFLLPTGLSLTAGDFLLPAPGAGKDFKFLHSLKLDYSPSLRYEWRNFAITGEQVFSTTGSPESMRSITYTDRRRIPFRGYVSPLATGALVTMQAYANTTGLPGGAYLNISHDSSPHTIATVGLSLTPTVSMGMSSPATLPFGLEQAVYGSVSDSRVTGKITINGWIE